MKTRQYGSAFIGALIWGTVGAGLVSEVGCTAASARQESAATALRIARDTAVAIPPYAWPEEDEAFLDEVQRGAFNFFWNEASVQTGCAPDRTGVKFASVAGVGFQLSCLPIGVERGWVTREEAAARARLILDSLASRPENRKAGMFFHFLDMKDAAPMVGAYEVVASTIDSGILFSGMLVASSYFGGDIAEKADMLFAGADWSFYVPRDVKEAHYRGFMSLGWKAADPTKPAGDGKLLPFYWADAGDEQRLVMFLAASAPESAHRVDPSVYYKLRRRLGEYGDGPFAWFPWSGALFTSFFAHCWIDYAHMGEDDPAARGVERRTGVDWWENARRTALMHRRKAIENPERLPGIGADAWGLSACDAEKAYIVPGLFPREVKVPGAIPEMDFATHQPKDAWEDGTVAPYTAGSAIMFLPKESMAALRHYRSLKDPQGVPLVWRDPAQGGQGFFDSYTPATGWRAPGCVAIDQGPLILAIENARTGLVWKLFHEHRYVQAGSDRLGLLRRP